MYLFRFIASQHSVCLWSVLATCLSNSVNCRAANYWYSGFIRLQSVIDAAIIQVRQKTVLFNVLLHTVFIPNATAVYLWRTDENKAFSLERDGREGGHDGPARLCRGAEVLPRPHFHLLGPGLHTFCHLPHCQRGSWEGAPAQRHHDDDGALRHCLLVRKKRHQLLQCLILVYVVLYGRNIVCGCLMCRIYDFLLYYRLSWGLLYAVLVTIMSILMSIIATCTALFPNSDFFVIFIIIFLYGISSVSRTGVKTEKQLSNSELW